MIAEGEIRRLAANGQVDPMVLNLDYSLTWLSDLGYTVAHGESAAGWKLVFPT